MTEQDKKIHSSLRDIDDVQDVLLKDKPLLVLKDGDSVEVIPITPVREEQSRFNVGITQYRIVVYVPASKVLRQFILSKQRFMRLNNLIGKWSTYEKAALVRITRNGEGIASNYTFELVSTAPEYRNLWKEAVKELTTIEDETWADFVNWAQDEIRK